MAMSANQVQSHKRPPEIPLSRTAPSYLHSNSTSHAWPFGAFAELIDNAYDPDVNATSIFINTQKIDGMPCLTFTDDGYGLNLKQMHKMLSFGFSDKEEINGKHPIGTYGNGFKSGSMRLGKDAIVFSKKENKNVVGFLSQTYLKKINAEDIQVPIVEFNDGKSDHKLSLTHIKEYSIFKSDEAIQNQLKKITSTGGTRIIIYNLSQEKVVDMNNKGVLRYELDTTTDPYDILIAESKCVPKRSRGQQTSDDAPRCDFSLRAYCSVLYLNPKIKIYLKTKKVRTVLIAKSLKETEKDVYRPWEENQRVRITFGFNPKEHPYGVCFYHNNRLIKSYQRLGYQKNADNRGFGIVGIIDCNFLTPTHNKQDFKDSTAHSRCIKAVGDKLNDYWNEKRENVEAARTTHQFLGSTKDDLPDHTWVQCDYCSKWRKLPDSVSNDSLPDVWSCSMNKDLARRDCNVPQEPENSDDEISKPTYDKSYKKREAKKKLEQKMTKSLQQKEKNHENQKYEETIKSLKEELAKKENKNAQKEVNKPDEIEQESTYSVLLNLKKELLNQKEQLDTRVMDVEKW
ncbi:MORC family CW-type zinc finger protein 3-like isoform X2 [Antedon mediterranea]|uniref:MORC family CW-type zinc finger protein 3-like isoform X2 n=1 Tax=Antedon mediterranea TaxID=105859 RepID=UPI003AF56F04